jgi:hypothetical protein
MKALLFGLAGVFVFACIASSVNVHGNVINADTGYQNAAAAPQGHVLSGNGTVYVDKVFPPFVTNSCTSYASTATAGCTVLPDGKWEEWAQGTTQSSSGSTQTVSLPVTLPNQIYSVMVGTINENSGSPTDTNMAFFQAVSYRTSSVTVFMMRNADHSFDPAAPTIWVIGN